MKGLMISCTNSGGQGCHPDVEKHRYAKEIKNGEDIPLMPSGKEQDILDEICKNCDSRYLVIQEQQCPICDSKNIEKSDLSDGLSRKDMTYRFKCSDCEEIFGIHEINLK